MSNVQIWEIRKEIDCHSVNDIYYPICKMCNKKDKYIEKILEDNTNGFKVTINQHIFDCKIAVWTCKFPRDVSHCHVKNNCLQEPRFNQTYYY